jgi:hypothetical protein
VTEQNRKMAASHGVGSAWGRLGRSGHAESIGPVGGAWAQSCVGCPRGSVGRRHDSVGWFVALSR